MKSLHRLDIMFSLACFEFNKSSVFEKQSHTTTLILVVYHQDTSLKVHTIFPSLLDGDFRDYCTSVNRHGRRLAIDYSPIRRDFVAEIAAVSCLRVKYLDTTTLRALNARLTMVVEKEHGWHLDGGKERKGKERV